MDCRKRAAARDSTRGPCAPPTDPCRSRHANSATPRVACAVVCAFALLTGSPANAADPREAGQRHSTTSETRVDLRLRPRTAAADPPAWLGEQAQEMSSSWPLFTRVRRPTPASNDGVEWRRIASSLRVRENSFPNRKVALQGAVREGFFLKVSLGVDHELERGGIGRERPSVGLQFEKRFR
jgi:hypothetical protein